MRLADEVTGFAMAAVLGRGALFFGERGEDLRTVHRKRRSMISCMTRQKLVAAS